MKNLIKFTLFFAFVAMIFGTVVSCKKKANDAIVDDSMIARAIPLTGDQVIPGVTTTGRAYLDVSYKPSSKVFTYNISWEALSSRVSIIKLYGPASRTENGLELKILPLNSDAQTMTSGFIVLDGVNLKESDLLAGKWYVKVQTMNYPEGELRGQITF